MTTTERAMTERAMTEREARLIAEEHPARYSPKILAVFSWHLAAGMRVLDPMAGVGGIHRLRGVETWSIELEPEWVEATKILHPHAADRALVGDCRRMEFEPGSFDAIAVSPVYGNRMSDHHDARDASKRHTYRHALRRMPTEGSSAVLQWGEKYRDFHAVEAWPEAIRVLRPGGLFLLNISDHVRKGKQEPVAAWHISTLRGLGLVMAEIRPIETRRQRFGENGSARANAELVVAFRKP